MSDGEEFGQSRKTTEERPRTYSSPDYVFTVYKKRWLILIAFFLLNFFQCVATICLTAFLLSLASAFNANSIVVTLANTSSALLFLPMFVIATQMFNTMSSRKALLICSIMLFIGIWLRPLAWINNHFYWIVIGQTIIGLSSPITTGAVSIIANNWFADTERAKATSLMLASNPLGIFTTLLIQTIYGIIIDKKEKADPLTPSNTILKDEIFRMIVMESILTSLGCIYFWIVFRTSKPPAPPSLAATRRQQSITQGMCNDFKILMMNRNFVLLTMIFALLYAQYAGFGFILNYLLTPLHYSSAQQAFIAMVFVLFGTIGAMSTGIILDRTQRYTLALKYSTIGGTLAILSGVFFLNGTYWGGVLFAFFGGSTLTPILPIGFSLATESTHPVQPALVTGFMMSMG